LTQFPAHHAIAECDLKSGEWVGIVGCGGLGLFGIQYAKAMGLKVVGIDINDETLVAASKAGADHVFNSMTNKTYAEDLKKATNGGVHAAVVFAGSKPAYDGAPTILRMNGLIMAIGLMSTPLEINTIAFMRGLFRIKMSGNMVI
jgi:D-arabinose 1-dehydrogenase-like Zn-dependent alcohol dehydrogenase